MIIRDPIHGIINFPQNKFDLLLQILNCPEMQRLRYIRQLGVSYLVFPGADHTRFSHSIGTAYIMMRFIEQLKNYINISCELEQSAVIAALVHDLGHASFSHFFEDSAFGMGKHEDWTVRIINSDDTSIGKLVNKAGITKSLVELISGNHNESILCNAISGPFDVDRLDYLLRDSYYTGTHYGSFDLDWFIYSLRVGQIDFDSQKKNVIAIDSRRGLRAIEGYFWARMSMFQQVYFHKTARSAEFILRSTFQRAIYLIKNGKLPQPIPEALRKIAFNEMPTVVDYLELDDSLLLTLIKLWSKSSDQILSDLSLRLINRKLFKSIILDESLFTRKDELLKMAIDYTKEIGYDSSYYCGIDEAQDVPYKIEEDAIQKIWVIYGKDVLPLSNVSRTIEFMRNWQFTQSLLIVLPEVREKLLKQIG